MPHESDSYKRVLYIDLEKREAQLKLQEDVWAYIGGLPLAYKLFADHFEATPVVIATGCLSGYFPYLSKACLISRSGVNVVEKYGGGTLAGAMRAAAVDAMVLSGTATENLHLTVFGDTVSFEKKKDSHSHTHHADILLSSDNVLSKGYFSFGALKETPLPLLHTVHIDIKHVEDRPLEYFYDYEELYQDILNQYRKLTVEPRNNPSCFGCPMGCDKSHEGEDGTNIAVLPRTLVACGHSEEIYRDIPFVYSCLSSVRYRYQHEHLERIAGLHGDTKMMVQKLIANLKDLPV